MARNISRKALIRQILKKLDANYGIDSEETFRNLNALINDSMFCADVEALKSAQDLLQRIKAKQTAQEPITGHGSECRGRVNQLIDQIALAMQHLTASDVNQQIRIMKPGGTSHQVLSLINRNWWRRLFRPAISESMIAHQLDLTRSHANKIALMLYNNKLIELWRKDWRATPAGRRWLRDHADKLVELTPDSV
jgi:hypothetical protein